MDLLKKELEKKKLALQSAKAATGPTQRYIKASELRRLQDEAQDEPTPSRKRERRNDDYDNQEPSKQVKNGNKDEGRLQSDTKKKASDASSATTDDNVAEYTPSELTHKLRQMGLPVRLFGEIDGSDENNNHNERLERLRQALALQHQQQASMTEENEFRLGQGHGIRNPFLEKEQDDAALTSPDKKNEKKGKKEQKQDDDEDLLNDPSKRIHKYFKGLLSQWEDDLVHRSDDAKRSVAGRNETKTWKQCKDYIRPLFKLCKKRQLEDNIGSFLIKIIEFCEQGEFVRANDAYMDLAIGRAAWPIGVTQVGIHSRTGREKIESSKVAHVMNSELQRKYLTSVKRLMTYAQKKSDVDPSKKVLC